MNNLSVQDKVYTYKENDTIAELLLHKEYVEIGISYKFQLVKLYKLKQLVSSPLCT